MFKTKRIAVKSSLLLALAMAWFYLPLNSDIGTTVNPEEDSESLKREQEWIDNIFNSMTQDERIGQLFMIRAHSDKGAEHEAAVERLIKDYHVGGLCFFQGTPEKQVQLINRFQAQAKKIPIMVSMDAEWGLGMRFKSDGFSYPKQLMLGAIQDNTLIYNMGRQIAKELRRTGVHINFAPVVDVNNNPNNPVINTRSFGEDRYNVTAKSYMYMKGMQDNKVMACAKHFPGHGDTDTDSHYDLPQILHSRERLDSIEMFPFQVLSQHGIQSMMVAHLFIPAIDNTANLPTTLSDKAVTDILKGEMNFKGLIFTDGLGMQGVSKHHASGELEVKALKAGNDVLLLPESTPIAFKKIKESMNNGSLDSMTVYESVKKIIRSKYKLGLTSFSPISVTNVRADITGPNSQIMKRKLTEKAMTLVRNKNNTIPFKDIANKKIASLAIGTSSHTSFQSYLSKYSNISHSRTDASVSNASLLITKFKSYDEVVVSLHNMSSQSSKAFGVKSSAVSFLTKLQEVTNVTLVVFGNPYSLKYFDNVATILECYDDDPITEMVAAHAIYGAIPISGKLPITASEKSKFGDGISTNSLMRLQYDIPESVGMDSRILASIDTIAQQALSQKATPGMQVLIAKDGKVVFQKSYGYHTGKKRKRVQNSDIFDLASLTKVMASTISIMKLQDEGEVNVYNTLGTHLTKAKGTNKENILLQDIMAHQGRLLAWIPFYKETISKSKRNPQPLKKYYKKSKTGKYNIPVTSNLFLDENYLNEIWKQIWESDLQSTSSYKYSDLGFYMMAEIVKENGGMPIDQYAMENFYKPLGLGRTMYNPLDRFPKTDIIPSEIDRYFRRQTIQGHVHDMGAAMMGGVSGHAGLFSTGGDLAVICQMLLNGGYYGGTQYIQSGTIRSFATRYPGSTRRGLGFDMKQTNSAKSQNVSEKASYNTYGHTGFTGTAIWIDPDTNLVYIFLSNRTYPNMNNFKLNKLDIRPRIQTVLYEAMGY
jgi:beta-N-acetylhexosaminidase